jgi:hypothetical protein
MIVASIIEQQQATSELVRELQRCRLNNTDAVSVVASVLSSTASLRLESLSTQGDREDIKVDYLPIDDALYRPNRVCH